MGRLSSITVHVQRARNLPDADPGKNKGDPYVLIQVGAKKEKTRTVKNTQNPEWEQRFTFPASQEDDVLFKVFDDDTIKDDFLGSYTVKLARLNFERGPQFSWLPLVDTRGKPAGELAVSIEGQFDGGRPASGPSAPVGGSPAPVGTPSGRRHEEDDYDRRRPYGSRTRPSRYQAPSYVDYPGRRVGGYSPSYGSYSSYPSYYEGEPSFGGRYYDDYSSGFYSPYGSSYGDYSPYYESEYPLVGGYGGYSGYGGYGSSGYSGYGYGGLSGYGGYPSEWGYSGGRYGGSGAYSGGYSGGYAPTYSSPYASSYSPYSSSPYTSDFLEGSYYGGRVW